MVAIQESITIPHKEEFGYKTGNSDFEGTNELSATEQELFDRGQSNA